MNDANGSLPITSVMLELRRVYGNSPTYIRVWNQIAAGNIPGHRVKGRWFIRHQDLPAIAAAFGLTAPDGTA